MDKRKLNRRGLFRNIIPETANHVSEAIHGEIKSLVPRRRPPGATDEAEFISLCTRCDQCIEACPPQAIHKLALFVGVGGGTPVMLPENRACHMCEGFPCVTACETGALRPPPLAIWKLGEVRLVESRCLPFSGPECGACAGLCPGEETGIRLRLARPQIEADACIGCGLCIEACPTDPKALEMVPLELPTALAHGEHNPEKVSGETS